MGNGDDTLTGCTDAVSLRALNTNFYAFPHYSFSALGLDSAARVAATTVARTNSRSQSHHRLYAEVGRSPDGPSPSKGSSPRKRLIRRMEKIDCSRSRDINGFCSSNHSLANPIIGTAKHSICLSTPFSFASEFEVPASCSDHATNPSGRMSTQPEGRMAYFL
jgi:hypothetical protein